MKCQVILFSCAQASTAFDVNSVSLSETIIHGSPCRSINEVRSRATRRPEMEVSGIAARDFRRRSACTSVRPIDVLNALSGFCSSHRSVVGPIQQVT